MLRIICLTTFLLVTTRLSLCFAHELVIRDLSGSKILGYYERQVKYDEHGQLAFIQTRYLNSSREPLVSEQASFSKGQLIVYEIDHKQLGKKGKILFEPDEIIFEKQDNKLGTKQVKEKRHSEILAPLGLVPFIEQHLADLKSGKTLEFRLAVWDRLESIGMRIRRHDTPSSHDTALTLKMEPSSFLIRQLVNPFYFFVRADGKVVRFQGLLPFKESLEGSKLRDIEGLLPIMATN